MDITRESPSQWQQEVQSETIKAAELWLAFDYNFLTLRSACCFIAYGSVAALPLTYR